MPDRVLVVKVLKPGQTAKSRLVVKSLSSSSKSNVVKVGLGSVEYLPNCDQYKSVNQS